MDTSPHKSDLVTVNGIRLHYLDWGGNGPVLLFLAGIGSNAHLFDRFAPRFTDQFHVLALTRRGHGESDYPDEGYDLDTLIDDIRLFMDCLHIEKAVLVQHTNEGIELPHFAALYPDRVQKLVFLEPAHDRNSPMFKTMIEEWSAIEAEVEFPAEDESSFEAYVAQHNQNFPANAASWCPAREEDLRHQMRTGPDGKLVYPGAEAIRKTRATMYAYTPEFSKITSPTLAFFPFRGERYYVLPFTTPEQQAQMIALYHTRQLPWFRHCVEQFRQQVPHAKIVELEDSHTYFFITQEELVYNEMKGFLQDILRTDQ